MSCNVLIIQYFKQKERFINNLQNIQMQFANVSALIDKVVQSQVHNIPKKHYSLYLYVAGNNPLFFQDSSKVKLVVNQDDLTTYLAAYEKINIDSTVCLENCEVFLDYGTNNQITSCEIQSKNVIIDVGTQNQKKPKNMLLKLHIDDTEGSEVPLLPSTRRYLRRLHKQQLAKKFWSKGTKTDVLNFIGGHSHAKKQKSDKNINNPYNDAFQALDTDSLQILKKLQNFINKDDLLKTLIKQPLKNKGSKKLVRLLVVPTEQPTEQQDMSVAKKKYQKDVVRELMKEYENK